MRRSVICLATLVLALLSPLQAQVVDPADKHFRIPKVDQAPLIDGRIDPDEWAMAAVIEDFHEMIPVEFSAPAQRTRMYFMYTEDALYVAAYAFDDNPDQIVNRRMRHSTPLRNEDHIYLMIDPLNNKRSGYMFETNANGIRNEGLYTSANSLAFDWTGIWNTASRIVSDGWTTEMEIPFKTLNLDPDNETWGVNVRRRHPASQTFMAWYSRNGQLNPANAGTMTGFQSLNQGMGLDLIPSFSTSHVDNRQRGSDTSYNPSLDLSYKLTSQLNLTLTWNTDFAATEVDAIQLDLDRFSPRLAEKRSFFLTDMNVFNFSRGRADVAGDAGPDPFFSRTIGISATGEPVDLNAGAKLSGRVGSYDVGALIIRQDEFQSVDPTNIFVGRIARGLFAESQVGLLYTRGDPRSNDQSSTMGVDFTYRNTRLGDNRSLEAALWMQRTDTAGMDSDNLAWNASVELPSSSSWFASARVQEVQENFDPRLGFSARNGFRQYALGAGNNWIFRNHDWIRQISTDGRLSQFDYLDNGDLQSRELNWKLLKIETRSGDSLGINIIAEKQVLRPGERAPLSGIGVNIPPGEYSFTSYGSSFITAGTRAWNLELTGNAGEYYTGDTWNLKTVFGLRPNRHLSFDLTYALNQYDMPEGKFFTRVVEFENLIAITPDLSLVNLIQYENVSDALGFNSRLRWTIEPGQDIWFVLSHGMRDENGDGNFTRVESSASLKVRYTVRF